MRLCGTRDRSWTIDHQVMVVEASRAMPPPLPGDQVTRSGTRREMLRWGFFRVDRGRRVGAESGRYIEESRRRLIFGKRTPVSAKRRRARCLSHHSLGGQAPPRGPPRRSPHRRPSKVETRAQDAVIMPGRWLLKCACRASTALRAAVVRWRRAGRRAGRSTAEPTAPCVGGWGYSTRGVRVGSGRTSTGRSSPAQTCHVGTVFGGGVGQSRGDRRAKQTLRGV
ncbi:Uncharacterised protein [Nocardia brasiliensis]|nr:Uncharacterised protein [Nocardia brasiliensis]